MIGCLQLYLKEGLIQSAFVNLKIRQLSAETSHDFIEWCGLLKGTEPNQKLVPGIRNYKNELYFDFVNEYPDYSPKSKMTISRIRFYKWLHAFCLFKEGVPPEEGRDTTGRWFMIREKKEVEEDEEQYEVPF